MEQKELRQYAENILKDFDYHYSGYSDTNGQSMYFDVDGIKVRFSDHSVSNRDRMSNEIHFDLNRIGTEWSNFNVEQRLLELRYRLGDKNIKFGKRQILMPSGKYLEAFGYSSNKTYAKGGYVTYKDKYNKKYEYEKNASHTLEEVSKDTGVSMKGLQQIYNKGIGAYKTNPSSVRPNVNSKEQWAMARVYSAVMGGKASNIDANELKMEKGGNVDEAISKLESVTSQQKNTIKRIVSTIERANGKQTISILNIRKGHVILNIFNVRDKVDVITTTTFCDVEINTKGNITKGFYNYLTPKVETKYPYMEKGGFIAPNGKPSNLTPEQYKLVRSESFKAWFGDWENDPETASKVVDENGEPLVVYHGSKSNEEFNVFKQSSRFEFIYFAKTKEYAWFHFTKDIIDKPFQLRPFFLNIRNLLNGEEYGFEKVDFSELKSFFYGIHELSKDIQLNPKSQYRFWEVLRFSNDIYDSLKNQDYYDGISFYENFYDNTTWNDTDDYSLSYVVMNPNQIKLADGTNKTFDGGNPDIRFDEGGQITNYTEFYDSLVIEDGSKYIGQKFNDVFPFISKRRITPHNYRLEVKAHKERLNRLKEDKYTTPAMRSRDLNKIDFEKKYLRQKEYLSHFVLDQKGTIIDFMKNNTTMEKGGTIGVYTSKLIEELKKYSNYEKSEVFTNSEGEKYCYHHWKLKYRSASNWLVKLFMRASKENTGVDYNKQFAVGDYSFYYDRPEFKGQPNGSIKMRKLEVLGKYEKGGLNWYGKGGIKERFAEGGKITQYEIEAMRNYINSDNPNAKLKESFEKVLRKFGVDSNTSDLSTFPKGKYINTYDFSGYEYMSNINEKAGVFFLLTGEYQLVSKAIFEKDYSMWLFYNYLGRINISMKACQDWLNQAQDYFESSMPIPIFLVHTPRAKDGRSYAMWCAVSEGRKEQAQSRIGRPLTYSYKDVYYYQEIGLVGNYDFNNDGWGTLYTEKKTGLLIPEYTETSFHFNTLIHEFAHCLDFQTQLLSNIEKFESKTPEQKETYLNTENMTEAELALYSKQLTKEALKQDNVAVPITNHFDEFVDSLIRILRACASGNIPLTQLYEQQALDVQQALAGKYGDLLLEQRIKRAKEAKELSKEEELRDNKRFSWQTSWIYDIKEYALQNSVNADLKAKLSSKSKYALTLVEALELDNLITGYFNTEFKKYMLKNPTKATQRLEDIKELKKETNRIINNHYDNVKANYHYGYKPNSELELYIRNNCDIRNFRDYKSWKECAKEKLESFQ